MAGHRRWSVRAATVEDLPKIVDVLWEVAAEGRWLGAEIPFDRDLRQAAMASRLADPKATILVAVGSGDSGDEVVGYLSTAIAPYGVAELGMAVASDWRGTGIGTALLDAAIAWATDAGAHKMALEVWPTNSPALALYRKAGFVEEGRKRRHYRRADGHLWDAVLMGRALP